MRLLAISLVSSLLLSACVETQTDSATSRAAPDVNRAVSGFLEGCISGNFSQTAVRAAFERNGVAFGRPLFVREGSLPAGELRVRTGGQPDRPGTGPFPFLRSCSVWLHGLWAAPTSTTIQAYLEEAGFQYAAPLSDNDYIRHNATRFSLAEMTGIYTRNNRTYLVAVAQSSQNPGRRLGRITDLNFAESQLSVDELLLVMRTHGQI